MSVLHHTVKTVTPFHDRSRHSRLLKIALWVVGIAVVLVLCHLGGLDVLDWFQRLWDTMTEISIGYIVAGLSFQTIQTVLTAVSWYFILVAGYPNGGVRYRDILAAYAAGVAMNGFLPANIGTIVSLLMYVALDPRLDLRRGARRNARPEDLLHGDRRVRLPVPLPLRSGTFDLQLGFIDDHRLLVPLLIIGAVVLVYLVVKKFWSKAEKLWDHAKQGGAILADKRDYVVKVLLPSFGSWIAKLAVIGVFLAAYSIPVTFHTIMSVVGGNSLANTVSFTPGGVGVTQAVNSVSLSRSRARERSRLLARPADHRHRLELRLRARPRRLGVRLDRREAARGRVVHGREGEGGGAVGRPQGPQGGEEGGQALGRRRLICSRGPVHLHR